MGANIRKMTKEEFSTWIKVSVEQQAIDRSSITGNPVEEERKGLVAVLPVLLPDGLDTTANYFYSIDTDTDKNIGYIWFSKLPGIPEESIFLMDVHLLKEHRSKGYGRTALNKAHKQMKEKGYEKILLNVLKDNYAKNLYLSMNYTVEEDKEHNLTLSLNLSKHVRSTWSPKKTKMLTTIIAVSFILELILSFFFIRIMPPLLTLALYLPFYVTLVVFNKKSTYIKIFGVIMALAVLGNIYTEYYMFNLGYSFNDVFIWNNISLYCVTAATIMAFVIAVKEHVLKKRHKLHFVLISLISVVFLSYYYFIITFWVGTIFGLNNIGYTAMYNVLYWVQHALRFVIMGIQVLIVKNMAKFGYFDDQTSDRVITKDQKQEKVADRFARLKKHPEQPVNRLAGLKKANQNENEEN